MKKGSNKAVVAAIVAAPEMNDIEVVLPKGRPIDENSDRQKRLKAYDAKVKSGVALHRGRPSDPTSARQLKLAGFEVKKAEGQEIKRGRPSDATSVRQQKLAERTKKINAIKAKMIAEKASVTA